MTVIICIWAVICILDLVLVGAAVMEAKDKFRMRYPDLTIPKRSRASTFSTYLRLGLYTILPIIQLSILWVLLFRSTALIDDTIRKTYLEVMEEKRNAQKNSDISDSNET